MYGPRTQAERCAGDGGNGTRAGESGRGRFSSLIAGVEGANVDAVAATVERLGWRGQLLFEPVINLDGQ
jgi:hypothetical protein